MLHFFTHQSVPITFLPNHPSIQSVNVLSIHENIRIFLETQFRSFAQFGRKIGWFEEKWTAVSMIETITRRDGNQIRDTKVYKIWSFRSRERVRPITSHYPCICLLRTTFLKHLVCTTCVSHIYIFLDASANSASRNNVPSIYLLFTRDRPIDNIAHPRRRFGNSFFVVIYATSVKFNAVVILTAQNIIYEIISNVNLLLERFHYGLRAKHCWKSIVSLLLANVWVYVVCV